VTCILTIIFILFYFEYIYLFYLNMSKIVMDILN